MSTIVQNYGPIYGEIVNGTVQGRPNGSVYVPLSNVITLSTSTDYIRIDPNNVTYWRYCNAGGSISGARDFATVVATSQDLASNIVMKLFADSELTAEIGISAVAAGQFNINRSSVTKLDDAQDETVYLVAYLMNNGTPVATSNVVTLTDVTP